MNKFFFSLFLALFPLSAQELKTVRGAAIAPYVKDIADLCLTIYREYPYSYEGTEEEYFPFIEYYAQSDRGVACLLLDNASERKPSDSGRGSFCEEYAKGKKPSEEPSR